MGIYECDYCGEKMCGISYGCDVCGFAHGDEKILCEECANYDGCDVCGDTCCRECVAVSKEIYKCCGMVICGTGRHECFESKEEMREEYGVERDACVWDHKTKKLECGHEGCNFFEKGCYTCNTTKKQKLEHEAIQKDKEMVQKILEKGDAKSDALKECLQNFLGDPTAKKRKRPEENHDNTTTPSTNASGHLAY